MPRYTTKTYSRKGKNSDADKEFDDLFDDPGDKNGQNLSSKTASTHQKWGNMTYSRVTRKSAMQGKEPDPIPADPQPSPPPSSSRKRQHCEDSSGDPFSFDSDDDKGLPRKRALQTPPTKTNQILDNPQKSTLNKKIEIPNARQKKEGVENTERSLIKNVSKTVTKDIVISKSKQPAPASKEESTKVNIKSLDMRAKIATKSIDAGKPTKSSDMYVKPSSSTYGGKIAPKTVIKPKESTSYSSRPAENSSKPKKQMSMDMYVEKVSQNVYGIRMQEEHAYAQKSPPRGKAKGLAGQTEDLSMSQMEQEHAYAQKPLPNKMEEEHAYAQRIPKFMGATADSSVRTRVPLDRGGELTTIKITANKNSPIKTYGKLMNVSASNKLGQFDNTSSLKYVVLSKGPSKPVMPRTSSAPLLSSSNDTSSGKDDFDFDDEKDDFFVSSKKVKAVRTYSKYSSVTVTTKPSGSTTSHKVTSSQTSTGSMALSSSQSSSSSSHGKDTPPHTSLDTYKFDDSDNSDADGDFTNTIVQGLTRKVKATRSLTGRLSTKPSKAPSSIVNKIKSSPAKKAQYKATYNARPWQVDTSITAIELDLPEDLLSSSTEPKPSTSKPGLVRAVTYPTRLYQDTVTSLKCNRQEKPLYTVVKHVKQAHQCQESGESQEFIDDVEYLLDGLNNTETMSTRCLSAVSLASKCSASSFRMHLRAHGMVAKIFTALQDAAANPSLAISTAALLFMLSKDRLNMDLDRKSLSLLVQLMNAAPKPSSASSSKEYNRTKEKLRSTFQKLPIQMVKNIDLNCISTNYLAMESLLSLTSKKAGEWFKEELRVVGGLDHIVHSVASSVEDLSGVQDTLTDRMIDTLKKAERCLQVLESVTYMNTENQSYLITFEDFSLVSIIIKALRICEKFVQIYAEDEYSPPDDDMTITTREPGPVVRNCMLAVLRVLLNLTHDNEWGSTKMGEKEGLISTALCCVLQAPQYLPNEQRFDVLVLSLGLLINLVEHSAKNRKTLVNTRTQFSYDSQSEDDDDSVNVDDNKVSSIEALVQLFLQRQKAAKDAESQKDAFNDPEQLNDKSGEWIESEEGLEWVALPEKSGEDVQNSEENLKKTLTAALHKAGKHMEDSIVASYIALLVGCLIQDSRQTLTKVKQFLPDGDFGGMADMLRKFLEFMSLTTAVGNKGTKSISQVIEVLESS
ncbi:wings apart-like protein homolog [Glandiceps talaboti]